VVLPQAFRLALPSVTNDFIALLKDSSLVRDHRGRAHQAHDHHGGRRALRLPGLLCAGLYFAMSYPLSLFARRLEARLARS
jgi:polar amino acid transport system substrate-binding protein